ncbi:gluconokinase [Streptomyces sp. NBC_00191]|uniref:gluconokinase n=1 Tax=Streptomyces sp. NBC_00191 TaxID=2975674 RepID=UPI00324BC5B2
MGSDGRSRGVVVVMGVAGCGKSTIGRLLAEKLGVSYAEADDFHPPANIAKMAAGQPLDDDDRRPWLTAIAGWIRDRGRAGEGGVVSCSALKRRYRDMLCEAGSQVWFLHLTVERALVGERVAARSDHFMPVSLVDSQFEALEPLQSDEPGVAVDASATPEEIVREAVARLSRAGTV